MKAHGEIWLKRVMQDSNHSDGKRQKSFDEFAFPTGVAISMYCSQGPRVYTCVRHSEGCTASCLYPSLGSNFDVPSSGVQPLHVTFEANIFGGVVDQAIV